MNSFVVRFEFGAVRMDFDGCAWVVASSGSSRRPFISLFLYVPQSFRRCCLSTPAAVETFAVLIYQYVVLVSASSFCCLALYPSSIGYYRLLSFTIFPIFDRFHICNAQSAVWRVVLRWRKWDHQLTPLADTLPGNQKSDPCTPWTRMSDCTIGCTAASVFSCPNDPDGWWFQIGR